MRIFKIFICFATVVVIPIGYAFLLDRSAMTKSLVLPRLSTSRVSGSATSRMAQVSQEEARKGIDKVVAVLKRDASAKTELGQLDQVTAVLGYGSPTPGTLAVRFNASFKKGGFGRSAVPLPFGMGQSEKSEGRGQMVGQVKASLDMNTGKVTSCSVFRDLGYGRAFNLKC